MNPNGGLLAQSLRVRAVRLRNRVIGAPMERNYCDLSGRVTPRYVDYLARRAAGGVGLIFTESCYITQAGKARHRQMGLHADHVVENLARLAEAVHRQGAALGVELNHGGRVVPSAVSQMQPVAPSPIACEEIGGEMPRELSSTEIDEVVVGFAYAARRAVDAGVDVLSIHGAHGYLIGQFLSPRSNRRTDEFGNPTAFLNRVLAAVRAEVGGAVPLMLRLSAFEGLPDGLDEKQSLALADDMDLDLVDVVDLSAGTYGAGEWITPSGEVEEGYLAKIARRYRSHGRLVSIAGRITTRETAERLLADSVDLVAVARALHADPDWARHAIQKTTPRPCISCNQGCADVIHQGVPLWCAVNPETGDEGRVPITPARSTSVRHRIVVVGGGPAGLEAARTAARAGFTVRLIEQNDHLGGQFAMAARLKSKPQFHRLIHWYEEQLATLGVEVTLGHAAVRDDIDHAPTAGVVVATGGGGFIPAVPVADNARLVDIRSWLARDESVSPDSEITIWGADRTGVYVADDLAHRGCMVVVVAAETQLARDAGARERQPAVKRLLESANVQLELGVTVDRVLADSIVGRRGCDDVVVRYDGPLLVSQGTVPTSVPQLIEDMSAGVEVRLVGEAAGASTFDEAIATAHHATSRLCVEIED